MPDGRFKVVFLRSVLILLVIVLVVVFNRLRLNLLVPLFEFLLLPLNFFLFFVTCFVLTAHFYPSSFSFLLSCSQPRINILLIDSLPVPFQLARMLYMMQQWPDGEAKLRKQLTVLQKLPCIQIGNLLDRYDVHLIFALFGRRSLCWFRHLKSIIKYNEFNFNSIKIICNRCES